ncbi:MAG: YggS family pyridoxal phosphate-dependent enzyme [Bacteroidota bacterium]
MIAENLNILRNRIEQTCTRCGRKSDEIQIVAVSKTFGVDQIREVLAEGLVDFGENYVQELQEKRKKLPEGPRWHFIGHLQSNKAKYIVDYVRLIHSLDSLEAARELQKRAEHAERTIDVLVEVHTTDEATKYGVMPEHVLGFVREVAEYDRVKIRGLMTMGPFSDDPNDSRSSFRRVAGLKKEIEGEGIKNVAMEQLSMGMTHDFEVAIEEGATIIRVGTAIFGLRKKN